MRLAFEREHAGAAEAEVLGIDGLQVLALVLGDAGAGEAAHGGMRREATVHERGAAAVQAADEHQDGRDRRLAGRAMGFFAS